jgi:hypothetical protein
MYIFSESYLKFGQSVLAVMRLQLTFSGLYFFAFMHSISNNTFPRFFLDDRVSVIFQHKYPLFLYNHVSRIIQERVKQ